MARKPPHDSLSDDEAERRATDALRRALIAVNEVDDR
jgi:hypothetical protein